MDPTKALELSSQYGVATVVLFIVVFYMGGLIYYVLKQNRAREIEQGARNDRREERLATLIEVHLKAQEDKTQERHLANMAAMSVLSEADRRQREEHELIITAQRNYEKYNNLIVKILERIMLKLKMDNVEQAN